MRLRITCCSSMRLPMILGNLASSASWTWPYWPLATPATLGVPLELVLVDDGSSDRTLELLLEWAAAIRQLQFGR